MTLPSTDEVLTWLDLPVHDDTGTAIGTCRNVYVDDDTQVPEWVEVELPDDGVAFVPTLGASASGDVLRVAHSGDLVSRAPRFEADARLEQPEERALYEHYGVPYSQERSDTLLPAEPGAADDDAPPPPAPRRLRALERGTPPPAPSAPSPAPPPPVYPAPVPEPVHESTRSGPPRALALLLAVPAVLLLARRRRRAQRSRPGTAAAQLLLPLAAGGAAQVYQRRRTHTPVTPAVVPEPTVVAPPAEDRTVHLPV